MLPGPVMDTLENVRHDLADDNEKYSFGECAALAHLALESASFIDASVTSPIVLTSLPAARGRVFEAVALIGADAATCRFTPRRVCSASPPRAARLADCRHRSRCSHHRSDPLLSQGSTLLSWQAWHNDEPNPASPLVLRLQALHLAAWGSQLPEQASAEPPACASVLPAACVQAAPSVLAAQLPQRYSPTAYQTLLDCPYRFFVKSVLGIHELDEADDALDKSDYGNALHRILKPFMTASRQPSVPRIGASG